MREQYMGREGRIIKDSDKVVMTFYKLLRAKTH